MQTTKNKEEKFTVQLTKEQLAKLERINEIDEAEELTLKDEALKKKNWNFIQLYKENMPEMRWLMANHAFASSMLFFIMEHMDNRNALAASYEIFIEYFGKSRTTVYRSIKLLQENGFLDVYKMGSSNVYVVNEEVAWTDKNNNKKFAKYDGKILISRKENKDYDFKNRFDRLKALREEKQLK